ncbi:MAG: DUF4190 domain-containing protein [Ruminococcus sp.]|nr:DUF4190 domain-containing protein [Ruminococcus sp.]
MSNDYYIDNNVYYQEEEPDKKSGKKGFAIASLVLGIVSVVCCCCGLGFIAAPLALIFGIISLAKHRGGTAMSIVGIVLAAISLIFTLAYTVLYGPTIKQVYGDYITFVGEADTVIEEYQETGELPDYLEKYNDDEYEAFWKSYGYESFNEFFDDFIDGYNEVASEDSTEDYSEDSII